jgi:hypothetical protein
LSPDKPYEPLLDTAQAAEFLHASTAYVKDHCTRQAPYIKYHNLGTKKKAMRRFYASDLREFVEGLPKYRRPS